MRASKLLSIVATSLLLACSAPYSHTGRGVEVRLINSSKGAPQKVRLEAITPNIIHVTATPERRFTDITSLMLQDGVLSNL